jgi:hypothetical protein
MEMLAIYFALADNQRNIWKMAEGPRKKRVVVNVRSDSKTSVEQLQGISKVRDGMMRRICSAIRNLLDRMSYMTTFHHLNRTRNIAGLLLEQRQRKEEERRIAYWSQNGVYASLPLTMPHALSCRISTA